MAGGLPDVDVLRGMIAGEVTELAKAKEKKKD